MFTQTGEHTLTIKLPGLNTVPIDFDLRSLDYLNSEYLQGALGHKMIEHSVGLNINRIMNEPTKNTLFYINGGGKS